jgi:carboxyl-terminal processing protease
VIPRFLVFAALLLTCVDMARAAPRAVEPTWTPAPAPRAAQELQAAETFDAAWTIVRDTHFDQAMNGLDWNAVRTELRPRAVSARSVGELRAVLRDMLGRLGQSHFAVIPGGDDGPTKSVVDMSGDTGIDVRLIDDAVIVSAVETESGAAKTGVRPGWKVVAVGGTRLEPLVAALHGDARLRNVEAWRIAQERLRGPAGTTATATFEDNKGALHDLALPRRLEAGEAVTVGHLPTMFVRVSSERRSVPGGLTAGVIRFNVWMTAVDREFQKAMDTYRNADGIVIDLRGNPGGFAAMLMGISGHFVTERKALGTMKTRDTELRFVANPRFVSASGQRVQPFAGPVAILVDAMSGSASECFTGGMQGIGRARVFGQVSMGQALPALFDKLPNGDVLIHAYGDFVAADGTRLEGRGVVPDEIVPLTRRSLVAGEDATMDAALAWIAKQSLIPHRPSRIPDRAK